MSIVTKRSPFSATAELLFENKIGPNPTQIDPTHELTNPSHVHLRKYHTVHYLGSLTDCSVTPLTKFRCCCAGRFRLFTQLVSMPMSSVIE